MNFYETEEKKRRLKKKYIICNNCHSSGKILINNSLIHVKCNCRKLDNLRTHDFIDYYINH